MPQNFDIEVGSPRNGRLWEGPMESHIASIRERKNIPKRSLADLCLNTPHTDEFKDVMVTTAKPYRPSLWKHRIHGQ